MPRATDRAAQIAKLREQTKVELRERSVEPFVRELSKLLDAAPTERDLAEYAAAKPQDWANMVKTFANLAGYAERTEVQVAGIIGHIHKLSDAQLNDMLRQLLDQRKVLDIEPDLMVDSR